MPTAVTAQGGTVDLVIDDRAALLAMTPAPTCQVNVTDVHYEFDTTPSGASVGEVKVSGVAWGTNKVDVAFSAPSFAPVTRQATVNASKAWNRSFTIPAPGIPVGTRVRIEVVAAGGGACDATAALTIALGETMGVVLFDPGSCRAGFEHGRNHFVGGYADRLVRTRFFVPLLCSYFNPPKTHLTWMARAMSKVGVSRREAFAAVEEFAEELSAAGDDVLAEAPTAVDVERMSARFRATVDTAARRLRAGIGRRRRKEKADRRSKRAVRGETHAIAQAAVVGGLEFRAVGPSLLGEGEAIAPFSGLEGTLGNVEAETIGVVRGLEQYSLSGWLGTIFYDRLRFRPSGLVAGDQVYSLALAPGEEATLTQRSETKRSRSFEDVLDRTAETELEFSSTWSTDITQDDTTSASNTTGGNLGLSVGIPIEGVEIGINAGVSAQNSNTISASFQRARTFQTTGRYAAKAREQHKTTFKVSTDLTEEFGSKRVLRNSNPSRALTLNFYKLYQKHRVLLERYDAKLSVGFCIDDPGKELRREIEEEFQKLNPKVAPGVCPEIPQGSSVVKQQLIVNQNAFDYGGDEWGRGHFETVLPPNTVLSSWELEIITWMVDDGGGNVYTADPTQFLQYGGRWGFTDSSMPQVGLGGAVASTIEVLMPEAWGPGWWTVSVTAQMTLSYVPTEAITNQAQACLDAEKKRIRESFSAERVSQILDEVIASRLELVLQRLFQTVLLRDYYAFGTNPPCQLLERVRNFFDWNEAVVEYLPWWMTPAGQDRRERLRQLLLSLPGDTRSDILIADTLVASAARIYLPIRPGQEQDAVAFLLHLQSLQGHPLAACIDDFISWREQNLGPVAHPLPTYDQVLDIGPARATPAGESAWEFDWERARREFLVLDEWSEYLPTDGVHVEPGLSSCGSVDEFRSGALRSDLESAEALREVDEARSLLERSLAAQPAPATTLVIGDLADRR